MFSLKLLGGAVVYGPDGPLTGRISQRRRLALLAALALAGPRPTSRDKLLAFFWPESDAERARHSLADSVYQIRKELSEKALSSIGEDLLLNGDVVGSDVREFENAIERGDLQVAIDVYGGPFLDGFHLGDAPEFERWVDGERDRLARAYARALEQLAEEATAKRDMKAAVDWWRRLLAADPHNTRITLRLMEVLEAAGDRAGAIQHARTHGILLEQDFGAEPDPEVAALAERLRADPVAMSLRSRSQPAGDADPTSSAVPVSSRRRATAPDGERHSGDERASGARPRVGIRPLRVAVLATALMTAVIISIGALLSRRAADAQANLDAASNSSKSIAVLPCANMGGNAEDEYFSDGLTEEMITVLSQVQALRVVARTSAFAFKGQNRDIREVGEALSVGTVVECSVRRAGDRFRVTAQLINTADGFHLWAKTYDREGTDIFEIQSDLALHIAEALQAELKPAERARLSERSTTNADAYALYLKGRHFWNQRTSTSFKQSVEYFERAIALDSLYAPAHAGLSRAYALQGVFGFLAPGEARERMRIAALKAVALDDDLAAAHTEMGSYLNVYAWESEASEREYLRAIELDPSYSVARHLYGNLLDAMGRYDEALAQKRMAVQLDPLAPQLNISLGYALLAAGQYDKALAALSDAVELDSMYWRGHAGLGDYYASMRRYEEAIRAHRRAAELAGPLANAGAGLARVLAQAGHDAEARRLLAQLQTKADRTGIYAPSVGLVFLALNDNDGAFEWLEKSYQQRHPNLRVMARINTAPFEDDARFLDLMRRIGLKR